VYMGSEEKPLSKNEDAFRAVTNGCTCPLLI
jgi:hypothetical protein